MLCSDGFLRPWLVEKHKDLLDVIRWAPLPGPDTQFAQAKSCSKNKGILDENRNEKPSEHNIHVDDDLMGDIPRRMPLAIASAAEAIFTVMGVPMLRLRHSAVAMAKWRQLIVAHQLILLGFLFNTRTDEASGGKAGGRLGRFALAFPPVAQFLRWRKIASPHARRCPIKPGSLFGMRRARPSSSSAC